MSDVLSVTELTGQQPELLPARTVMSLFSAADGAGGSPGTPGEGGLGVSGNGHNHIDSSVNNHIDTESAGISGPSGSAHPGY